MGAEFAADTGEDLVPVGDFMLTKQQLRTYQVLTNIIGIGAVEERYIYGTTAVLAYVGNETVVDLRSEIDYRTKIGKNCKIGRVIVRGRSTIEDMCWLKDGVALNGWNTIGEDTYLMEDVELAQDVKLPSYSRITSGRHVTNVVSGLAGDYVWLGYRLKNGMGRLQIGCQDHSLNHWRKFTDQILSEQAVSPATFKKPLLALVEFVESLFGMDIELEENEEHHG